jgi:hypothetical protein
VAPEDLPAVAGLSIAFSPWHDADALLGSPAAHTALAALDLDDDRDLDLAADGAPPRAVLNDRLGRFHEAEIKGFETLVPISSLLWGAAGRVRLLRPCGRCATRPIARRRGRAPRLARNRGNGRHWLALDLTGRWMTSFDHMHTNPHRLGVRLALEGQGLNVRDDNTTTEASLAQSVAPVVLGLGTLPSAVLLRLLWPDGTMQRELNVGADQDLVVAERNRKSGSCPALFT